LSQTLKIKSSSPADTQKTGATLAKQLGPGSVVALYGQLGAGKTVLVQGICQGLGAEIPASSPSFVIVKHYPGRLPVYHLDLYRLNSLEELINLGYEEYFYGKGICLIEWAEKAGELLPAKRWDADLIIISDQEREIQISQRGGE